MLELGSGLGKCNLKSLLLASMELLKVCIFYGLWDQVDSAKIDPVLALEAHISEATCSVSFDQHFDLLYTIFCLIDTFNFD